MSSMGGVGQTYPVTDYTQTKNQSAIPVKNSSSVSQEQSGSFFSDPSQAAHLSSIMEGLIGGAGQDYLEFIRNPTASPYFQNAYQGILAALAPQAQASRQSLTDQFRAAGGGHGMTGGAHQVAAGQLEGDIYGQQLQGLSQLLTTLFPQVTNALFAPLSETDSILNAMKLQESKKVSYSNESSGPGGIGPYGANTPQQIASDQAWMYNASGGLQGSQPQQQNLLF